MSDWKFDKFIPDDRDVDALSAALKGHEDQIESADGVNAFCAGFYRGARWMQCKEVDALAARLEAVEAANGQLGLTVSELQAAIVALQNPWVLCSERHPTEKGVYFWAVPYSGGDKYYGDFGCYIITSFFDPAWLPLSSDTSFAWMEIPKLPEAQP